MKTYLLYLFIFVSSIIKSQSLIINEVSNGPSGSAKEYIELVVVGTSTSSNCTNPCVDLRGMIIDDNSDYHGPSGNATGAIRFSPSAVTWSCVPLGTIILIYNDIDKNVSIPANDLSLTDGNCRMIIPASSTLFQKNTTDFGNNLCFSPASAWTTSGDWPLHLALANGGDCMRILSPSGCELSSVCYGTANLNQNIYFAGSGQEMVYYFNNGNPTLQANWSTGTASVSPGNQTPGSANNALNAAYIAQYNNNCSPFTTLSVSSVTTTNVNCGACNGTASVTASGSTGVYTYTWVNSSNTPIGQNTSFASNLCAGVYSVIVRSSLGCTVVTSATISSNNSNTLTINSANETCGNCNGSASVTVNGATATYTYSWIDSNNLPINQTTDVATNLCSGTYSVIVNSSLGCTNTQSVLISNVSISNNLTVNSTSICSGSSAILSASATTAGGAYAWLPNGETTSTISVNPTSSSNYTVTYSLNNCTTTAIAQVTVVQKPVINIAASSLTICPGETATLTATGGSGSYNWSNTLSTNSVNVTNGGTISLIDNGVTCGPSTASIVIATSNIHANISANTTSGIKPLAVTFTNTSTGATSFTWTLGNGLTDLLNNTIAQTYTATGIYTVSLVVTNNNCKDSTSILITVLDEEPEIEIPNVFTPNGDGINDVFKITAINTKSFSADIFNRWGTKLFSWSDITTGWNGKTNGKEVTDGVYFYMIKITTSSDKDITKQGTVSLFR